jgi:WD40 repeat protein/serine/threonine protein kinase
MTIQPGRWVPSAEELADVAANPGILQTLDSSFLGVAGPASGTMQTLDSGFLASGAASSGGQQTLDSGFLASGSSGSAVQQTLDSSVINPPGASSAARPAGDGTEMWDSSHVLSESAIRSLAGKPPSSVGRASKPPSSSAASKAASQSVSESLEQSLVIQPRVLRPDKADETAQAAERIDYNLLKKLGEGGMGIVYAARQQSIRRVVALKMLKSLGEQQQLQREKFLAEAVITGDLEHPNIVPIYDLGRDEAGAIFYAMKHVKGTPWDKLIKEKSVHENLDTLMKVADAVAFAHSRDVVHRDLKPENVMLGDFGEVLVMDWGLALSLSAPPATAAMGGTPAYMAPEMAMGPIDKISFYSDVYLLGAILYEIVTGQRPHAGTTVTRCLMAAAKNEIAPTQKSGELLDIARKAMATKPKERYQSVREFQSAIREYQSHTESIALGARAQEDLDEARRNDQYDTYARALFAFQEAFSLWDGNTRAKTGIVDAALAYAQSAQRKGDYDLGLSLLSESEPRHQELIEQLRHGRQERESRQRRLRTARRVGMALVAAIFVIVTGAFFWIRAEANRARKAEVVAKNERTEAVRQKGVAEEQRAVAVAARAEEERQRHVAEEQRAQAIAARQEEERQRRTAEEQRAAAIAARQEEERQRQLADAARKQEEYEAYVAKIGLAAAKIEENAFDHALALISECPPALRHWEWGRLSYLCTRDSKSYDAGQPIEAITMSPDGKRLATGGWGGEIRIFAVDSGETIATFPSGGSYVFALAFSPDGKQLAAGTNARPDFVTIWDAATGQKTGTLKGHSDAVLSVAYSRDGSKLLTGSYDNTARLWDLASGKSRELSGHDWWVWSAAFSPDEQRIVTASQDGSVIVWSAASGQAGPPFLGHGGPVYSAVFSPDGKTVASASYDKRILLWRPDDLQAQNLDKAISGTSTAAPTPFLAFEGHSAGVRSVRFSSDGKLLVSGGNDNAICVWDVVSRQLVKKLRGHASRVAAVIFAPGDDRIVSGAYDHSARLWNISKYEEVRVLGGRVLKGHRDSILGAAFSPDGKTVVTASRDRSAIAWDVASGKSLRSYDEGHAYLASAALFFPDGKRVLTSAVDNTTRIWDVAAGTQFATLEGTGNSAAVAMPHSAAWIATGSNDKSIQLWEPTGKLLRRITGFTSDVTALAVSPSDQFIFAGDGVGRCRLLRVDTGAVVWESRSHSRSITAASFLPNGERILTASIDNTVGQWDAATGSEDQARVLKHPNAVTSLAVSPDGSQALTACADKIVRLWDVNRATVVRTLSLGDIATTEVAFSPDGRRGMTATADNRLRLWDLATGNEISPPGEKKGAFLDLSATTLLVWSAAFSADGDRLLTVGGAEAHLWDALAGKQLMSFSPQSAVSSVHFSNTGDRLVTGSWDNAARIWNAASGAALMKLGGVHTRFVNASVFSPDGTKVLTASDDKTVRMWDAATGKLVRSFVGHEGRVTDVAFSSDGKSVLTASDDKTARIWDAESGNTLRVLRGHSQAVLCAEFSADDKRVITGSDDTTARLWDATTGEPLPITLEGHTASVTSVAFFPDGKRALTGSKDITTKLWDPATGKEILTLTGHTQEITTVAVSPDGGSILTGSRDGTAIVWLAVPWKDAAPVARSTAQTFSQTRE